jgi:membrane fusion protein, multidrug efflux system
MTRLLLTAVLVAILAAGYYFRDSLFELQGLVAGKAPAAKSNAAEPKSRPPPAQSVIADVADTRAMSIQVKAIGTVQPIATVTIKSRIDGQIDKVHFEEGQEVKEGDLLFTLDNRAFQAQLAQTEATLERDRAQLQRAHLELKRQTELASRGVASAQKLEEAQTAVKVFDAAIQADQAAIENAHVNLNYTSIRAPITGRTGSINLKRGSLVKSNDTTTQAVPLVTITQLQPIYVTFTVPERHLADLRTAISSVHSPKVIATIPNERQQPVTGALTFIDNQVDVATGTISLKATFANSDAKLWPGQFVNVTLMLGLQADALVVPSAAVQIGQNGPYVFVIKSDSAVELRLVRIDRAVDNMTVIAEGLAAGERVVVDGQLRLSNGSRVSVQRPDGAAPPGAQNTPLAER